MIEKPAQLINSVVLHLGSNMGDRHKHLKWAFENISRRIGPIDKCSKIYNTEAWGKEDQPDYLNAAAIVQTTLGPHDIIKETKAIEKEAGSDRKEKWGKRKLDIDLLFYEDQIIDAEDLRVPHPFIHKRNFVLVPLNDIIPFYRHPQLDRTIEELTLSCRDPLKVEYFDEPYEANE